MCANGPAADEIVAEHALELSEGNGTPFERMYEIGAFILLLGVGFNRCTALHFAESRLEKRRVTTIRLPVREAGKRTWIEIPEMATDASTHFPVVGERFVAAGRVQQGTVGNADSMLFGMQDLVVFASDYFEFAL